jgi:hypothetical protein
MYIVRGPNVRSMPRKKNAEKKTRGMYATQTKERKSPSARIPHLPFQKGNEKKTETRNTEARGHGRGGRRKEKRPPRKSQVHFVHHQYSFIRRFWATVNLRIPVLTPRPLSYKHNVTHVLKYVTTAEKLSFISLNITTFGTPRKLQLENDFYCIVVYPRRRFPWPPPETGQKLLISRLNARWLD